MDSIKPNMTKVDQNRLNGPKWTKCYADMPRTNGRNNKYYALVFRYYIDL